MCDERERRVFSLLNRTVRCGRRWSRLDLESWTPEDVKNGLRAEAVWVIFWCVYLGGKQERFADAELARPEPRFDLLEREKRTEEDRVPERRKPSLLSFKLEKKARNVNITLTLFVVVGKRQHYLPSGRCVKAPLSVKQYDSSLLLSYLSSFHMENSP